MPIYALSHFIADQLIYVSYVIIYLHLFVILLANCYLFSLGVVGTVNFLAIFTVVWFIVLHVLCSPMPIVY